jgi:RHS repeat-associated protein
MTYDGIYRLTNETIGNDPANENGSVSYGLDPVGNRQSASSSLSGVNSSSFTYTVDDETSTDTYDANGNTTTSGGKTFTFDSENHMTSMTGNGKVVTMVYDAFGNRVAKTVNGVTTQYLVEDDVNPTGLPQVVEETVNGVVTRSYTYGLERISQAQAINGAWTPSFYEYDGAGSVRQLTNLAANVTVSDTYEYDAFGNAVNKTGATPNNYLYRGEQFDPDLGLYYLRARYYNPATGRFLSVDPLADEGQRRYQYAAANPVDGMDPNGSEDLIEYALVPHIFPPVWIPNYCAIVKAYANGNEELIHDLGCGPAPRLKKTVKVCSRPLLKGKIPGIPIYPLGHWHHTYIEIDTLDDTTLTTATWGVLGENGGKNQEVIPNDSRDSLLNGGGCDEVPCINSEASTLTNMLNATVYPGSTCPSCGANYHNWWWRQPPDGNNSNTYTYNMIYNWGKNPPTELNAPGYHYSSGYAGYN